jgi:hypothetical protein
MKKFVRRLKQVLSRFKQPIDEEMYTCTCAYCVEDWQED